MLELFERVYIKDLYTKLTPSKAYNNIACFYNYEDDLFIAVSFDDNKYYTFSWHSKGDLTFAICFSFDLKEILNKDKYGESYELSYRLLESNQIPDKFLYIKTNIKEIFYSTNEFRFKKLMNLK